MTSGNVWLEFLHHISIPNEIIELSQKVLERVCWLSTYTLTKMATVKNVAFHFIISALRFWLEIIHIF